MRLLLVCSAMLVATLGSKADEKATPVKVEPTWKGSVEDLALLKEAGPVVTDAKAFAKLVMSWKVADKVPEVDFTKNIVLVVTSRGSTLNLVANKTGENLQASGFGTKDLRPGFRYVIGVVSRDGIKTVNGKELPKE